MRDNFVHEQKEHLKKEDKKKQKSKALIPLMVGRKNSGGNMC